MCGAIYQIAVKVSMTEAIIWDYIVLRAAQRALSIFSNKFHVLNAFCLIN